ncbi:nucleoside recognition domain-containing protein [uncultured Ruegeria sp.]|uniref:YjiH family protein n=1 Tax=uncultured Ruegeria sp. TaxID=259304 RepID=UPI0026355AB0|nr:nucleoside recognition domain-containing protein [uncultured Ruegeria sp.]
MEQTAAPSQRSTAIYLKLIIGSLFGFCFFMLPFSWDGELTLPIALLQKLISAPIEGALPIVVVALMVLSGVASLAATLTGGGQLNDYLKAIFVAPWLSVIFRLAGGVVAVCAYFHLGHEALWGEYTGEIIIIYLMPSLLVVFLLATSMLPFLLDFGGVEFVGAYLQKVFKTLFRLPGRASVLSLTSFVGSGTNGIIAAELDYKKGLYTGREVSLVCLGFGTISLPAVFIYSTTIGGVDVASFLYLFLTLVIVAVVSTMVLARIPPLSNKTEEYFEGRKDPSLDAPVDETKSKFQIAADTAYAKAERAPGIGTILKNGVLTTFELYMTVFPLIVLIGTLALIATEYTPLFNWLATPLAPVLSLIGLPEAETAAPAFLTGFADLLLPFLAAENIDSQLTKFVICITGTITIICMSETGAILLKSSIPLSFFDLLIVFLLKTVISVPIALAMGRLYGLT